MKKTRIIHLAALALVLSSCNQRSNNQSYSGTSSSPAYQQGKKSDTIEGRRSHTGSHVVPTHITTGTTTESSNVSSRPSSVSSQSHPVSTPHTTGSVSRGGFGHSVSSAS